MKNILKIFAPVGLAILLGSLTLVWGQTRSEPNGQPLKGEKRDFGRMPPPPFGFAPDGLNPRIFEQLNLSDAQKQQIRILEDNARAASQPFFEKLRVIQKQINEATESETFDEAQVRQLLKSRADLQTEIEVIRLKKDSAIYNLLTAEQIAKLGLLRQERPEFGPPPPPASQK